MLVRSSAFDSRLWIYPQLLVPFEVLLKIVGHNWLHIIHLLLHRWWPPHHCFGVLGSVLVFILLELSEVLSNLEIMWGLLLKARVHVVDHGL